MSKSDFTKVPVAPEFVETLQESAINALMDYLRHTEARQEVIVLAEAVNGLGYYLTECYRDPDHLNKEKGDVTRFGIEDEIIETINAIAALGGKFYNGYTHSVPREGTPLAEVKEAVEE